MNEHDKSLTLLFSADNSALTPQTLTFQETERDIVTAVLIQSVMS